jgi:elongation factor Ts
LTISTQTVKELRLLTGAGVLECKRVLEEVEGDLEKATELLRERGFAKADSKASRETREGLVDSYIHNGNRVGAIIEVNCESDFVARTDGFQQLVHNLAMQVAAMSPEYVDKDDIPEDEDASTEGLCLMDQPFIRDPSMTVRELVRDAIARLGENIRVRHFTRYALGE